MLDLQKVVEIITDRFLGCCRNSQAAVLSFDTKTTYTRSKFCLKCLHMSSWAHSPYTFMKRQHTFRFFISLLISSASGKLDCIFLTGKKDILQTGCVFSFVCLCLKLLTGTFGTYILLSRSFNFGVTGWAINLL